MWGRVIPDALGRPSRVKLSFHARQLMGGGAYLYTATGDGRLIHAVPDPDGQPLRRDGTVSLPRLLDALNAEQRLSDRPFAVRRFGGSRGGFVLDLYAYDDQLRTSGQRETALPMETSGDGRRLARQPFTAEQFVRLFAYAAHALGRSLVERDVAEKTEPVLEALPKLETVKARYGNWTRFAAFVAYQVGLLERRGVTGDEAKARLAELLEEAG